MTVSPGLEGDLGRTSARLRLGAAKDAQATVGPLLTEL
jgi:hypothetical protein